ncbi:MAG: Gfo/Idh/MocA family oxidoreductase [Thermoguttaceae bacterium]|jgi:predicted dehydrogenase
MSKRSNRRQFLQTTALTGIGFWIAARSEAKESKSPNERVAIACIGLGTQGNKDADNASKLGDIVAICDVDEVRLNKAGGWWKYPKAKKYADFRKMFDEMDKSIDAVTVGTPDHIHAVVALKAMRMGKHCYCQKPMTRCLYEARLMANVAQEMKVATQMGNQGTADASLRKTVAVIQAGALGAPKEIHAWTNRPIWPQGGARPAPAACPETLKWDLWIGPAPMRPYTEDYHPINWRGWWDFGTGAIGDMACHTINLPYWAFDLRDPISVQAETSGHNKDSFPASSKIVYEFAAAGKRPAVKLFWYDGGNLPDEHVVGPMYDLYKKEIEKDKEFLKSGCVIIGNKDTLFIPGDYADKLTKLSGDKPLPEVQYVKSPGHYEEWIRAIKGGEPAKSNFPDYSGPLTETVLLGNLAVWVADKGHGKKVEWDAKNLKCTNIEGLEPLIKPTYRPGYTLDV